MYSWFASGRPNHSGRVAMIRRTSSGTGRLRCAIHWGMRGSFVEGGGADPRVPSAGRQLIFGGRRMHARNGRCGLCAGGKITSEDFKKWHQDPDHYVVEDPGRNRSHGDDNVENPE
ncbi:GH-E family nuclease [Helcobacillus massiliensis]|uniref:GH-E family nuclease n=1 Tax=Helcobacillus massiliensis TaxID=521392 RepID=UPI0035CCD0C7